MHFPFRPLKIFDIVFALLILPLALVLVPVWSWENGPQFIAMHDVPGWQLLYAILGVYMIYLLYSFWKYMPWRRLLHLPVPIVFLGGIVLGAVLSTAGVGITIISHRCRRMIEHMEQQHTGLDAVVTTSRNWNEETLALARSTAERLGIPYAERRTLSVDEIRERYGVQRCAHVPARTAR